MLEQICDSVLCTYMLHFFFTIYMVSMYGENFKNSYSKNKSQIQQFLIYTVFQC